MIVDGLLSRVRARVDRRRILWVDPLGSRRSALVRGRGGEAPRGSVDPG